MNLMNFFKQPFDSKTKHSQVNIVLYHDDCLDGFMTMYILKSSFEKIGQNVVCIPVKYHFPPPFEKIKATTKNRENVNLIIADFCYKSEELTEIAKFVDVMTILDHHDTAATNHGGYGFKKISLVKCRCSDIHLKLIEGQSGATLAYDYVSKFTMVKPIVYEFALGVEDHDLWNFTFESTPAIVELLVGLVRTYEAWEEFFRQDKSDILEMLKQASIKVGYRKQVVESYVAKATLVTFEGHLVPFVNCSHDYASYVGQALYAKYPFAFMYEFTGNSKVRDSKLNCVRVSLRSDNKTGMDITSIAEKYNGGGHKHSAGFYIDIYQFTEIIKNSQEMKHD